MDSETNYVVYKVYDKNSSISCDTLKDKFSELPLTEDISIMCEHCKEFFFYQEIQYHRKIHKCLEFIHITNIQSLSFKSLSKHRDKLRKHIQTLPVESQMQLMAIVDSAYSTLYNYLIEESHQVVFNLSSTKEIQPPHIYKNISNQISPSLIELNDPDFGDVLEVSFGSKNFSGCSGLSTVHGKITKNDLFFGLVTGHDGDSALKFVSAHLIESLSQKMGPSPDEADENHLKKLREALTSTTKLLDDNLRTGLYDEETFNRWSSCCLETVTISRLSNKHVISSMNIGDGIIILVDRNHHSVISALHSTRNEQEVKRIKDMGGTISSINGDAYLLGIVDRSQIIGGYGKSEIKYYQMPNPSVVNVEIDAQNHLGIIIINSAVAKLITIQDAVNIFRGELFGVTRLENIPDAENLDLLDESLYSMTNENWKNVNDAVPEKDPRSKIIAKKLMDTAISHRSNNKDLGVMVMLLKKGGS